MGSSSIASERLSSEARLALRSDTSGYISISFSLEVFSSSLSGYILISRSASSTEPLRAAELLPEKKNYCSSKAVAI